MSSFLEILNACPTDDRESLMTLWEYFLSLPSEDRESLTVAICQKMLEAGLRDQYPRILQLVDENQFLANFCQKILQTEDKEYYKKALDIAVKLDRPDLVSQVCSVMRSADLILADRRIIAIALRSDDLIFFKNAVHLYCNSPERLLEVIETKELKKEYFDHLIDQYHGKYLNQICTMSVLVFSRLAILYPNDVKIKQVLESQSRLTNRRSQILSQGLLDQPEKSELEQILSRFAAIDRELPTVTDSKIAYQMRCERSDLVKVYLDKYREHLYQSIDNIGYFDRLHGKFVNDPRMKDQYGRIVKGTGACLPIRRLYEFYCAGKLSITLPVPYKMLAVMPKKDERRPNPKIYINGGKVETNGFASYTHEYDYSWHPLDLEVQVYSSIPDPTKIKKSQAELKRLDKAPITKGAKIKIKTGGSTKVSSRGDTGLVRFSLPEVEEKVETKISSEVVALKGEKLNNPPTFKIESRSYKGTYYLKAEKGYCYVYDSSHSPVLFLCKYITREADEREKAVFFSPYYKAKGFVTTDTANTPISSVHEITEINPKISQELADQLIYHFDRQYNPILAGKLYKKQSKLDNWQGCIDQPVDRDDPANQRVMQRERKEYKPLPQHCSPKEFKVCLKILKNSGNNPVIRRLWEASQYQTLLRVYRLHKDKDWSKLTLSEILS